MNECFGRAKPVCPTYWRTERGEDSSSVWVAQDPPEYGCYDVIEEARCPRCPVDPDLGLHHGRGWSCYVGIPKLGCHACGYPFDEMDAIALRFRAR